MANEDDLEKSLVYPPSLTNLQNERQSKTWPSEEEYRNKNN